MTHEDAQKKKKNKKKKVRAACVSARAGMALMLSFCWLHRRFLGRRCTSTDHAQVFSEPMQLGRAADQTSAVERFFHSASVTAERLCIATNDGQAEPAIVLPGWTCKPPRLVRIDDIPGRFVSQPRGFIAGWSRRKTMPNRRIHGAIS